MFSAAGLWVSGVSFLVYVLVLFVDFLGRRRREMLRAIVASPPLVSFVLLVPLGCGVIVTLMLSDLWQADLWRLLPPEPFAACFALSFVGWLITAVLDFRRKEMRGRSAFAKFQNPSRLSEFFCLVGLMSYMLLWLSTG